MAQRPRAPRRDIAGGKVHLRHQPAAENVTGGVGIGGHRRRADRRPATRIAVWIAVATVVVLHHLRKMAAEDPFDPQSYEALLQINVAVAQVSYPEAFEDVFEV